MDSDWLSVLLPVFSAESYSNNIVSLCHCRYSCGVAFFIPIELEWLLKLYSYDYSYYAWCEWAFKKNIEQLKKKIYKFPSYDNTSMLSKLNI